MTIEENKKEPSFAFEHVAVKLTPFDLASAGADAVTFGTAQGPAPPGATRGGGVSDTVSNQTTLDLKSANTGQGTSKELQRNNALWPIFMTNGLIFPYNPTISENVNVNYESVELTHSNEAYFAYKNTSNVRINLSNAVWTCDTFDNAIYALAALHFFRTYSNMDFGRGQSGRPPSPMWFSAYGDYAYNRVPVLFEKADWAFPNDIDYVGIPQPGTTEYQSRRLNLKRQSGVAATSSVDNRYTWLPMKFEVSAISLVVQHSPKYWSNWNLNDYRSGEMLRLRGSFHSKKSTDVTNGGGNL